MTLPTWDPPSPVLFNTWKHHAGWLRQSIRQTMEAGPAALQTLADNLVVVGTELMDLYLGPLTPAEIGAKVLAQLRQEGRLEPEAYRAWLADKGYEVLTFPEDGTRWVLRNGDEAGLYVHLHPGRWTPQTRRVRANVLKTAVLVLASAGLQGSDPLDLTHLNEVRRTYLDLSPLGRDLSGEQGLGALLELLK